MYRSACALVNFLNHFGDRWSLIIIRDMFFQKKTFNDFLTSPERIASNILTNRLKTLNKDGLIDYKINPENKKVKWYFLTKKAVDLYPIILEMVSWSSRNLNKKFGPQSTKWIKENNGAPKEVVAKNKAAEYLKFRDDLFNKSLTHS